MIERIVKLERERWKVEKASYNRYKVLMASLVVLVRFNLFVLCMCVINNQKGLTNA